MAPAECAGQQRLARAAAAIIATKACGPDGRSRREAAFRGPAGIRPAFARPAGPNHDARPATAVILRPRAYPALAFPISVIRTGQVASPMIRATMRPSPDRTRVLGNCVNRNNLMKIENDCVSRIVHARVPDAELAHESQRAGLVVFHVDNPPGQNQAQLLASRGWRP